MKSSKNILAVLYLSLLMCGCGGVSTSDVSGLVTFDGEAIEAGTIWYKPIGGEDLKPQAEKIDGGKYKLNGIAHGKYRVWIMSDRKTEKKVRSPDTGELEEEVIQFVPAKYNTRSEILVTVPAENGSHDFLLSS